MTTNNNLNRTLPARIIRRIDPGLLITLALCLLSAWPLLAQRGLPNGTDVLYHAYRVGEMDRSWAHGVFFPRWAEGMYYGYGSPLFHYYASLTYYITSVLIRLTGMGALDALRTLIVLCMLGSGAGMYLFMRQRVTKLAGVIAALVYVYSPYLLYTEPYARGAYPELLAFAVFPFVMWRFGCLLQNGRGRDFVLAALSELVLILSHNLMAVVLTGILVAWLVWGIIFRIRALRLPGMTRHAPTASEQTIRPHILGLMAAGLGIGMAAYFWLPVMLESGTVSLQNLTGVAGLDFRNFFISLIDLLSFPRRPDAGAINGLLHILVLGVAQWTLALAGVVGVGVLAVRARSWRTRRAMPLRDTVFFALVGAVIIFLITPASAPIWEGIGIISYLQFPWRFLGPFYLAVLAGMNALWIKRLPAKIGGIVTAGIIVFIITLAVPMFYVPEWQYTELDTSIEAYHAEELAGRQLGTTFTDEYRPRDVTSLADATPSLLADFADGYPIDRMHRAELPEGVTAELLDNGPQHSEWSISTDEPFTMEVLNFYWAGWTAEIGGETVEITPSLHHGLITFPVPAGEHLVRVYLGSTPARNLGNVISMLSVIGVVGVGIILARRSVQLTVSESAELHRAQSVGLIIGGVLALAVIFLRPGIAYFDSPPGEAHPAQYPATFYLGDEFSVIGYDLNGREFRPGDTLELNVYWYPRAESEYSYHSFVHVSSGGPPLAQADKLHPGGRKITEWWMPGEGYIFDEYRITLPETMPPGEYNLSVGLYTCESRPAGECGNGDRPPVTDADGNALGDTVPLGTVTVR